MALFRVETTIDASPARVWEILLDWEGSSEWMVDATTVQVLTDRREGVGTRLEAVTRIAGIRLTDVMEVTAWDEHRRIVVRHERWPIRGTAWWELRADGARTHLEWGEELDPPLGAFGELGAKVLRKPIERVLAKSLAKLRALAER